MPNELFLCHIRVFSCSFLCGLQKLTYICSHSNRTPMSTHRHLIIYKDSKHPLTLNPQVGRGNARGMFLHVVFAALLGLLVACHLNPAKRNVLDLKNETCKNREKRNVLKISHTRHFKTTKKQSKTGCFYSF